MGNHKICSDLKELCTGTFIYCCETIFAEFGTVNHPPSPIHGQELRILTCTYIRDSTSGPDAPDLEIIVCPAVVRSDDELIGNDYMPVK
ncbi:hypothetical protein AZE42_11284 [Rhizopogon vesiculosus]|uniref:Uncharacterized protein n=1 Tax=Rhizopogon vesiculosus TaxID=180088 RepID=A0A1J8QZK8_9AGAM|nr:hypothetical protein AZE42_11284 [Rhizopogon vesiculosus]